MERHEEEEEMEEVEEKCESGRRSRPINLATKVGVFVPGDPLISEERSLKLPALVILVPPLVLIRMFFWIIFFFKNQQTN